MDPASITGLVVSCGTVTSRAVAAAAGLRTLRQKHQDVPLSIQMIALHVDTIKSVMDRLCAWLQNSQAVGDEVDGSLADDLYPTIDACGGLLDVIRAHVERCSGASDKSKPGLWQRVQYL